MMPLMLSWILPADLDGVEGFNFEFGIGLPVWAGVLLVLAVMVATGFYAASRMRRGGRAMRALLTGFRCVVIGLAVFLVLDPTLTAYQIRPSDQTVAVVFDDSRSMTIEHRNGKSRAEIFREAFEAGDGQLQRELTRRFQVAWFGLGEGAYRVSGVDGLTHRSRESRITRALADVEREIGKDRLAGVILLSDGVEQAEAAAPDLAELPEAPVLAALLPEIRWREFEVGEFKTPAVDFVDTPVVLDVPLRAQGLKGATATVELIGPAPGGDSPTHGTIQSRTIKFEGAEETRLARFEFEPDREGWVTYTVRARMNKDEKADEPRPEEQPPAGRDTIPENNTQSFLLDLRPETYRIFYFSGRPNWENAFVRRALTDERQLAMTTHIRISEAEKEFVFRGKRSSMSNRLFEGFDPEEMDQPRYDEAVFLRFGREAEPLSEGYPSREDELFGYDLLVWSDVEYEFFNQELIRQTREFVRKRGGALLLLGGPNAFTEANYAGTLIESMLPVLLPRGGDRDGDEAAVPLPEDWQVQPTLEGEIGGALSLDPSATVSRELWDEMPPLSGLNEFSATRPGATVAAEAFQEGQTQPLYVYHRFGEGRVAALATGTTWLWKMQRPPGDTTHERIWKQLMRDLVRESPDPVRMTGRRDAYAVDELHELEFQVRDQRFEPREALQIHLESTAPSGDVRRLPVEESLERPGIYRAAWRPEAVGDYGLRLTARTESGEVIGELEDRLFVREDRAEFFNARPDAAWLTTIAENTGGRAVSLAELPRLAESIPWTPPESLEALRFHLWHWPPFYVALVTMLCVEWFLRRRRGLA